MQEDEGPAGDPVQTESDVVPVPLGSAAEALGCLGSILSLLIVPSLGFLPHYLWIWGPATRSSWGAPGEWRAVGYTFLGYVVLWVEYAVLGTLAGPQGRDGYGCIATIFMLPYGYLLLRALL